MEWLTLFKGAVIGGIILFIWNGLAQNLFPWGIKSVRDSAEVDNLVKTKGSIEVHSDHERARSGMFYLRSEEMAALVAAKPGRYYSMSRFLAVELVTQILVATTLTVLLVSSPEPKLVAIALAALLATFSIDLQYWNWWGFSTLYTAGVAFNRLVGFLLVGWILTRLIL